MRSIRNATHGRSRLGYRPSDRHFAVIPAESLRYQPPFRRIGSIWLQLAFRFHTLYRTCPSPSGLLALQSANACTSFIVVAEVAVDSSGSGDHDHYDP